MKLTIQGTGLVTPPSPGEQCDTKDLASFVPARRLRRIDHFTRMTLLAAHLALAEADGLETLPTRLGIILTTGYGPSQTTFDFLDSIIEDGAPLASPLAFSHSVHNIPAGVLSLLLGTPCPQTTICQLTAPVMTGLHTAAIWLAEGRVDSVLFGAVDEVTMLLKENTARLTKNDRHPGEGAAFFLLNQHGDGYAELELNPQVSDESVRSAQEWGYLPIAPALDIAMAARENTESKIVVDGNAIIQISRVSNA